MMVESRSIYNTFFADCNIATVWCSGMRAWPIDVSQRVIEPADCTKIGSCRHVKCYSSDFYNHWLEKQPMFLSLNIFLQDQSMYPGHSLESLSFRLMDRINRLACCLISLFSTVSHGTLIQESYFFAFSQTNTNLSNWVSIKLTQN